MKFKQWFLLSENPHATVKQPIMWQGTEIVILDLRAEDWRIEQGHPKSAEAEAFKRKLSMYQFSGYPVFFGRIPQDGRYLFHDGKDSFNFSIETTPPAVAGATNLDQLPIEGHWWDYVIGYDIADKRVKQPKMVRAAELPQPALVSA